jgi:PAS domain S-box-containing protein
VQTLADPTTPSPLETSRPGLPSPRAAGRLAVVALVYAVFVSLGLRWASAQGVPVPIWPAAGIAFAALVAIGPRGWPAIALGYLLAAWLNAPHPSWVMLAIALGNAGAAALGAWTLRAAGFNPAFERLRDVVLFISAAAASVVVAATVATFALAGSEAIVPRSAGVVWVNWYLADLAGVLVVASLMLGWTHGRVSRSRRWWLQFAGCIALAAAVGASVFLAEGSERRFTFLAFLPLIWAALSLRLRGATVVIALVAACATWGATFGLGPFAKPSFAVRFVDLQLFVSVTSAVTLALAVVADERRAQKALMLSEARLRLALEASHTGLWKLDIPSGAMTFSPECAQVTGLSASDVDGTRAGVMQVVHADDQAMLRAAFWEAVQHGGLLESVFRLVHPASGRIVWIETRGRAMFDANGHPESMLGTITDITERKRDEHRLAEQARLLDLTTDAIIIRDLRGNVSYWNDGAVEMYGYSREEATGRSVQELLRTDFPEPYAKIEDILLRTDRWTGELSHVARDGRPITTHARWVLDRDALGRPVAVLQTHTDITARKQVEANTRFLADLDHVVAQASTADLIAATGLAMLGRHLRLMRSTLSDIDLVRGRIRTLHEWTDGAPKVSGAYDARDFFMSELGARLASGEAVAVADVRKDPLTAQYANNYHPFGTVALAAASYVTEGRLAGTLTVASGHPRPWRGDEMQLLREVVARLWPAIERAKAVAALRESEARFRQMADTAPMMIWVTEPNGACSYVSRRWLEFTGRRSEAELGAGWIDAVHPDDRDMLQRTLAAGDERHTSFSCEFRALRWDGASIDITERREAEQALRDADRRKDEFLATLAHELRNPLSPIRTGLQVLNLTDDPETAWRTRQMMERQLGHMVRLIDDLLDVSRITSGKVVLQRDRISLQDAARAAVESARPSIEAARHRLELDLPAEPLWVDADPTRLAQVLGNLLTNAAKYTPDAGGILLEVRREGGEARIAVSDTGMGIPPDALGDVFGMFAQVNRTLDRAQGGLGIGLALARRLIEMHGGTISAHSEGLGRGSTFTVRLPLAAGAPAAAGPDDGVATDAPKQRVLVVDDNADAAESLAMMLRLEGHEARCATSAVEGLAAVSEFRPQVVFLDIGMPGMNGHEVARRLRADERHRGLYLIAASGWGGEADKRLAREAGFDLHLTKPVSVATVRHVLAEAGRREAGAVGEEVAPG